MKYECRCQGLIHLPVKQERLVMSVIVYIVHPVLRYNGFNYHNTVVSI